MMEINSARSLSLTRCVCHPLSTYCDAQYLQKKGRGGAMYAACGKVIMRLIRYGFQRSELCGGVVRGMKSRVVLFAMALNKCDSHCDARAPAAYTQSVRLFRRKSFTHTATSALIYKHKHIAFAFAQRFISTPNISRAPPNLVWRRVAMCECLCVSCRGRVWCVKFDSSALSQSILLNLQRH